MNCACKSHNYVDDAVRSRKCMARSRFQGDFQYNKISKTSKCFRNFRLKIKMLFFRKKKTGVGNYLLSFWPMTGLCLKKFSSEFLCGLLSYSSPYNKSRVKIGVK